MADGPDCEYPACARCGGSADWERCDHCGETGMDGHDCGDDCCCCRYPEDNVPCQVCDAAGGWWRCGNSLEWCSSNPMTGCDEVPRGTFEWLKAIPEKSDD